MYTQCPDCRISFRVTADVLKQAAGMVRCGGCSNAFNALDYLSEQMPTRSAVSEADGSLPELKPEMADDADGLPKSISAEQSAALLKTLDQLAGSDIRIEDTGVEWRVLDKDEVGEPADDDNAEPEEEVAIEAAAFAYPDNLNVDEFLEDSPTPVDEFLTKTPEIVDSAEVFDASANGPAQTPVEELRFDDNTPLPEDFGFAVETPDSASSPVTESELAPELDPEPEPEPEFEEPKVDIALSDPHEWTDILDEFEDPVEDVSPPPEARVDEETDDEIPADDGLLDVDTQFALQAEEMGLEISAVYDLDAEHEGIDTESEEDTLVEPEPDTDITALDETEEEVEEELELVAEAELEFEAEILAEAADATGEDLDDLQLDLTDEPLDELIEEPVVATHDIEAELDGIEDDVKDELDDEDDEDDEDDFGTENLAAAQAADEFYVPPPTEEEQTVNLLIDQDLMALAIEDEHGFASTIVIPESSVEYESADSSDAADEETPPGFETIIMEGEFFQSELDQEKLTSDAATAAEIVRISKANEAGEAQEAGGRRWGMIAGVAGLVLLLLVQIIHQSREALATNELFNQTIGPIYRALGDPLLPEWNVTGWQFEVTQDITDRDIEAEELTVYSRIANKSDRTLPYPLVWISLTDRFQETVGSQVVDPVEYLKDGLDPRKHVAPGNTFNAVISIQAPAREATGFKLNVCYRLADSQMRCAIDDFK